jgi:hypothetical protein
MNDSDSLPDVPDGPSEADPAVATHDAAPPIDALAGYRLQRLEVFNWGTFDGAVHSLVLDGQTTLLVDRRAFGC